MRKAPLIIGALSLVAVACSGGTAAPTTTMDPPVVTTSSVAPPPTVVITPESPTTSLEVWAPEEVAAPLAAAADAFEIETGIEVTVTVIDLDSLLTALLEDPAAGPDAFVGPHAWLTSLVENGVAEPIETDPSVVESAARAVELRGSTYAAPIAVDTIAQFRDSAALADAPADMESLADGCGVVDGLRAPCLAMASNVVEAHLPFVLVPAAYLFGPDEFDGWDKDDVGIDVEEALSGGLVLEDIVAGAGILDDGDITARDAFAAGAAPLFWGSMEDLAVLRDSGIELAVDELPTVLGAPAIAPIEVTALWVNAFSPDKEAAVDLVTEYLATPDSATALALALGLAPVDRDFDSDPLVAPFTRMARAGEPIPPIEATTVSWAELESAFTAIRAGESAATALAGAASNIRAGA
jgi:maltose-binding protein MalE